jgi:hypothetical protein
VEVEVVEVEVEVEKVEKKEACHGHEAMDDQRTCLSTSPIVCCLSFYKDACMLARRRDDPHLI